MGFTPTLKKIESVLKADATLQDYASQRWGKRITVKVTWRNRTEISASDLPLIMITRPTVRRSRNSYGKITSNPRARFYAGFYQPEEALRQFELIELEELILAALEASSELAALVDNMTPADGANDEGALGECCFTVQEIEFEMRS